MIIMPMFVGNSNGTFSWSDPILLLLVGFGYLLVAMMAVMFYSDLRTEYFNRGIGRKIKCISIVFPVVWIVIIVGYCVRWIYRELTGYGE